MLRIIPLLCLYSLLLSACGVFLPPSQPATGPTVTPTADQALTTQTAQPAALPTKTLASKRTPTLASTLAPTEKPTDSPDTSLTQASFLALFWQPNHVLVVSIQFPSEVKADQYRATLNDKDLKCEVLPNVPNRLYCWGVTTVENALATFRIYPQGSTTPGFEKGLSIPAYNPQ